MKTVIGNAELWHGDCLELMKDIPSGSVDAIITDPPYGTTACKWDSVIPLEPMWEQLKRIIKPRCAIVLFGTEPFSSALRMSNIKQYKYDWMWAKNDATDAMNAKNKPMRKIEKISVFSPGTTANKSSSRMNYYPQGLFECDIKRQGDDYGATGGSFKTYRPSHKPYSQKQTGYPSDLIFFSKDKEKLHPTQKPVALMEYLIKTYTNEGCVVLDFTMGSGTTGVACMNTGRKFIGIEMDDKYFEIARKRITESTKTCPASSHAIQNTQET
jgi:site-specific DNA-methyltransferase (adenine-specific)